MNQWDILWTTARQAEKVFPNLKAGQKVNRIPGMTAITRKVRVLVAEDSSLILHYPNIPHREPPRAVDLTELTLAAHLCDMCLPQGDLARSLLSAYNEDSYRLVPPSFPLPDELETWKTWKDPDCQGSSEACLWVSALIFACCSPDC